MSKLQELVKKYGKVAIGVHLGIYAATLAGANVAFQCCLLAFCKNCIADVRAHKGSAGVQAAMLQRNGSLTWSTTL